MLFQLELTIPFHNIYDVMRSYPSWNLRILDGTDGIYQSRAQQNDAEFIRFWDRVVSKPKETTYKTIEEGLDFLKTGFHVLNIGCNNLIKILDSKAR